ncbi:serum response factor-binding protein 1 [Pagrus major]|uniref:serum response factor-binding protein 1 n=1 Tax=Pagrus major TaxID=143350 RepID=UPI003CC84A1D
MIMDEVEKMEPSAEEIEKEEEEEEIEDEGGDDSGDEEKDGDDEEQEVRDAPEKAEEEPLPQGTTSKAEEEPLPQGTTSKAEEEPLPRAAGKNERKIPPFAKPKEKRPDDCLNLNNEVVRMRKEVKRVRALIIRKLTRQMGALKKKKGKDTEIERNQRRAARLLEEIHAIKALSPDLVTKTAMQRNLSFEKECKNPNSTMSDRAIARIATHPQFNKKIQDIKNAVKVFKNERMRGGRLVEKEKVQNKDVKVTSQSPDKRVERQSEKDEVDIIKGEKEIVHNEGVDGILIDTSDATIAQPVMEMVKAAHSAVTADDEREDLQSKPKNVRPASVKCSTVKDIVKSKPQSKDAEKKPILKPTPEVLQKSDTDEDESDVESSDDEEKEYFDDSTEERFHKQSSQSEESDDEDDFFVGKVSKFKKKKKKGVEEGKAPEVKVGPTDEVQSQLDELESRLKSKATSFQSVFCSSLSMSKPGGGRGSGRGRGGDKFRGGRGGGGLNRDFSQQSKFQKQEKGADRNSGSRYSKPESSEKGFPSFGRGRGRGRGGGVFSHQEPQQALHPSWEASKKRKEQQGQILAFQGKKIKFDDDD